MGKSIKDMDKTNKAFWRSIEQYNKDVDTSNEFEEGATDDFSPEGLSGLSRRKFLTLLGASAAFTAAACSDYHDQGEIVPYTNRPEGMLPGSPNYYASTCTGCSENCGILVKTRLGRPVKIDGNPEHPINKGKICSIGQAKILDLYDPSRIQTPIIDKRKSTWAKVDANVREALASSKGIALVTDKITSPSTLRAIKVFKDKYPNTKVYSYSIFNNQNRVNAWEKSYPGKNLASVDFEKADVILALESDFLGKEDSYIVNTGKFSSRRDIMKSDKFNRLYVAEANLSMTGANADYRLVIRPDQQFEFVMSLMNEIAIVKGLLKNNLNSDLVSRIRKYNLNDFVKNYNIDAIKVSYLVEDLINSKGKSIVYAGNNLSEDLHIAVNTLNYILDNEVIYNIDNSYNEVVSLSTIDELKELVDNLNNGSIDTVIHLDTNPVFNFPADYNYAEALKNAKLKITLAENENETSALADIVLPINQNYESWGDSYNRASVYGLQQPVIAPLYDSREKEAILLTWTGEEFNESMYHNFVMDTFKEKVYNKINPAADFKSVWFNTLHDGFISLNHKNDDLSFISVDISSDQKANTESSLLMLEQSYFVGDGRYANNGWLQEIPHPISKVTWDNYAALSPSTASKLGVVMNDMVKVTAGDQSIELPVLVQPGLAENTVAVELGYGREVISDSGKNVGFNAYKLLNSKNGFYTNCSIEKANGTYKLISSQEHHAVDDSTVKDFHKIRGIVRTGTLDEYLENPEFVHEGEHKVFSITEDMKFGPVKWSMAIDMNKCTSCAVCVASCNVENNIPVVGKDQVEVGREMQWMRIDRYYSGEPENPEVSNQPMLCQHCDNAPCENVCPVNATNHSPDGLNQMVYNRCVGTRYCANNCPYKVRRFNFFNFRDHFANAYYQNDVTPLVNNPEVTVRSRGVMEKCTFCVQNIAQERSDAIKEGREVDPSRVKTACQTACPADAIVFGDANNPESEVSKYIKHNLAYQVLGETNVRPAISYFAKLRNTHSEES